MKTKEELIKRLVDEIEFICSVCAYKKVCSQESLGIYNEYCKVQKDMVGKYSKILDEFGVK